MTVNVAINHEHGGKVTICVTMPNPWNSSTPRSFSQDAAAKVLFDFGFDAILISQKLKQLEGYNPKERINLGDKDIPGEALKKHGFIVPGY